MANNEVLFKFGSQAAYDRIGEENYEDNALYFITGEAGNRLYKGDQRMAYQQVFVVTSLPEKLEKDVAYVEVYQDEQEEYIGTLWVFDGENKVKVASGSSGLSPEQVEELIEEATKNMVEWSLYPGDEDRKAIVLANHDSLTGTMTDGDGANLVMLSKWDVADFGSTKIHANLNTSDHVTINDNDIVATISKEDVEAGKKVAVVEDGKEIATTDDVDEAIKDALNKAEEDNKFLPKWEELEED